MTLTKTLLLSAATENQYLILITTLVILTTWLIRCVMRRFGCGFFDQRADRWPSSPQPQLPLLRQAGVGIAMLAARGRAIPQPPILFLGRERQKEKREDSQLIFGAIRRNTEGNLLLRNVQAQHQKRRPWRRSAGMFCTPRRRGRWYSKTSSTQTNATSAGPP